jgi:guanine deaminase
MKTHYFRGNLVSFSQESSSLHPQLKLLKDGVLCIQDGKIRSLEPYRSETHAALPITDLRDKFLMSGLIDTHVHFPQITMMGSYGERLLEWLEKYTYPSELKFQNSTYSAELAEFFLDELLRNGTTTASVFGTTHSHSIDHLFASAEKRGMRILGGKVLMNRYAPEALLDGPDLGEGPTRTLIEKWHRKPGTRIEYALTPRFAPTSTPEQLSLAGRLLKDYPSVRLQTHLSENISELEWVRNLYPGSQNYFEVYEHYGLTGPRSVLGHGIHLSATEWERISETRTRISFCPSSNLFLGSGLFQYETALQHGVSVGLGSDVGAGTSLSLVKTLGDAYKVLQLQGYSLSIDHALYLATLGGARALGIDQFVGNLAPGLEADFIVLDPEATPSLARRTQASSDLREKLFAMMILGDERMIRDTYVLGESSAQYSAPFV